MGLNVVFLVIAVILFAMSAWSRWWTGAPERPYYPTFLSAGLFFWALAQLWPQLRG